MPQANEALRAEWHGKRVWQKCAKGVTSGHTGAPVLFGWSWVPNGEIAADRFLKSRGYREHRFKWYAPKLEIHRMKEWRPTNKEGTALAYLCDEWDNDYDLRKYPEVLETERKRLSLMIWEHVDAYKGDKVKIEEYITRALHSYAVLARVLA